LVGVSQDPTGLEVFTVVYDRCTVADVPVMPGKRSRSNVYYGVPGSEPDRESPVRKVVDYIAVTRSRNRTAPLSNEVLALVGTLTGEARARRQPSAGR
jgi:hypothetical protein